MKKLTMAVCLLIFTTIGVTHAQVYTPDWEFLERMQAKANSQVQAMIDKGYYYDDIYAEWVSPGDYATRTKERYQYIKYLNSIQHDVAEDGTYDAYYYFTNSPISHYFRCTVRIKKGDIKKVIFNSNASAKLINRTFYVGVGKGNIRNRRLRMNGKHITVYVDKLKKK